MAQKHMVMVVDDIDGTEGAETVKFGFESSTYEIDLSDENFTKLRQALEPFILKARKVSGGRGAKAASSKPNLSEIRAWAANNGHTVSTRGRIPTSVMAAYNAAH